MPSSSYASAAHASGNSSDFGSGSLHMSPEEIDQYLSAEQPIGSGRLWIPPRVAERTHHATPAEVVAPHRHHSAPVSSSASAVREAIPHRQVHSVELKHPGSETRPGLTVEEEPDTDVYHGYGTRGYVPQVPEDMARLLRSHNKVSRVAIPCAMIFGSAFVVALCYNNPPKSRGGMQQLATMDMPSGFACTNFLCPNSGTCAIKASDCPEGNPFLKVGGQYHALVECGASEICSCKSKGSIIPCQGDQVMVHQWTSKPTGGCGHILCPRSGECVTNPQVCSEGNPFANKQGPYFTEAMVAQAVLSERKALQSAKEKKKEDEEAKKEAAKKALALKLAKAKEAKIVSDQNKAPADKAEEKASPGKSQDLADKPASASRGKEGGGKKGKADAVAVPAFVLEPKSKE